MTLNLPVGGMSSRRRNRAGFRAPLASIGLMTAHSFVPFPAEVIAIANGMVFGLWGGIVVTWLGAMAGAGPAYELARALGPAARARLVPARHQARLDALVGDIGIRTLFVARLILVISFNVVNYAAGWAACCCAINMRRLLSAV